MTSFQFQSVAILGSTGSVGEQALDVARTHNVPVLGLVASTNWKRVAEQAREFCVPYVAMKSRRAAASLRVSLADTSTRVFAGDEGIEQLIRCCGAKVALNAILGKAGLAPTLTALDADMDVALANKESLVVAGDIVMRTAREKGRRITPVDSEHSAIFQTLRAGEHSEIKRLILTASGGPFYGRTRAELANVTVSETLAHPTWQMGAKITVDSATMMNKGFEIIEAAHLFDLSPDQIDVVVHRESIIHSMVEYIDNSIIAQMSVPDMRLCVQYALTAPKRMHAVIPSLDLLSVGALTFRAPDEESFPLLALAKRALLAGGATPAVLNAANEVAVAKFLSGDISMLTLFDAVERVVAEMPHANKLTALADILAADSEARERAAIYL